MNLSVIHAYVEKCIQENALSYTNREVSSRFEDFVKRQYSKFRLENFAERKYNGVGFESFEKREYIEITFLSRG
jgi:hypothetical protein